MTSEGLRAIPLVTQMPYQQRMDVASFDLNLLKAFDALYAERSVTHAGLRIGLSQSAMSGALTRLREVFEDELFVRTSTGMQPTPRAHDLAGPVADALRLVRSALGAEVFDHRTSDQVFTIAMSDYAAFVLLPPLLARLGVEAPRVDLRVRGMFGRDEAIALLDGGEADLAVGVPVDASARIFALPLFRESFVCVARRGHPAFAEGVSLQTFAGSPHLLVSPEGDRSGLVDRELAKVGLTRRVLLSLPQFLVAPFVIAETDLIATLSSRVARRFAQTGVGIVLHEPPIVLPTWPLAMMWHRRTDAHAATTWLRQVVAEVTIAST
jgi:DNA-binding transcriptional LysR family regulator